MKKYKLIRNKKEFIFYSENSFKELEETLDNIRITLWRYVSKKKNKMFKFYNINLGSYDIFELKK